MNKVSLPELLLHKAINHPDPILRKSMPFPLRISTREANILWRRDGTPNPRQAFDPVIPVEALGGSIEITMNALMLFPQAARRDAGVEAWFAKGPPELKAIARQWFGAMRGCGGDVRELLHDGHPTACVGEAAFGYVNAFTAHVNVGFFRGAELPDPEGLLLGTGKFMRHVKLHPGEPMDSKSLKRLIDAAYRDMKRRLTR